MANEPEDRYRFVYFTVYLLGMAALLPWQFFITANDYWMYKFRNVTDPNPDSKEKSNLQASFTSYLAIASQIPLIICLYLNTQFGHRISLKLRISGALAICTCLFIFTTVFVEIDTDSFQVGFMAISLMTAFFVSMFSAVLQGSSAGLAGFLPQSYMGGLVNGQAVVGIFASVIQILTLIGNVSSQTSAVIYFTIALLFCASTALVYFRMLKTEFFTFHFRRYAGLDMHNPVSGETTGVTTQKISIWEVFKEIKIYAISAMLIFLVTLCIFPALLVLMNPWEKHPGLFYGKLFIPICCFLIFNVGDLAGRMVGLYLPMPDTPKKKGIILSACILRVVFIPLIMLCNLHPRSNLPVVFVNDAWYIIFNSILAISNGYLCQEVMVSAPRSVQRIYQQSAGAMMATSIGLGLSLGSVISLGLVKVL